MINFFRMKDVNVEAVYKMGCRHLQGDGANSSYEEAVSYLRQAANLGHAKAQYNLGVCFHQGLGLIQSYDEAFHCFQLSAKQNHPRAHYMLGCYFAFGLGRPCSEKEAIHYFHLAAAAGLAEAQYNLGVLLLKEGGKAEAASCFKLAADQGDANAQYNLGLCYYQGLGISASYEEAIRYLELAVKQRQPKAARALEQVMMSPIWETERLLNHRLQKY